MTSKDFIVIFALIFFLSWLVLAWREPIWSPPGGSGVLQVSDTGDLTVTGSLNVQNSLNASGVSNFQNNVNVVGNLTVGGSSNPKGITLYATNTGAPYCLRVYVSGTPLLILSPGICP